jgi:glutamate synthase (NADPH) small chain
MSFNDSTDMPRFGRSSRWRQLFAAGDSEDRSSPHPGKADPQHRAYRFGLSKLRADLVLLAMGFVSPVHAGLLDGLGVGFARGNVEADQMSDKTSIPKIFACGDMRRGQSLIVWAIRPRGPPSRARRR